MQAILAVLLLLVCGVSGQPGWPYKQPTKEAMRWYDDAKFGLFIHWAPVSQWGDELSWPLVCPDLPCEVQGPNVTRINITSIEELVEHREAYYALAKTFNPQHFDPDQMAAIAKRAGFKYVVFTTEHCDGFCNFNNSYSDYNILNTPFGKDIFDMITKAFRKQDFKVGAYYCPSLWNNDDYWLPNHLTALADGCVPNYDPQFYPYKWNRYTKLLHNEVEELIVKYQPDMLWIDCISAPPAMDYHLSDMAPRLRSVKMNAVFTQRAQGLVQDFVTTDDQSEETVDSILTTGQMTGGHKFEVPSVLDAGGQWGYNPYAKYKSAREVLHNLIAIVAKGGNYLLNVGPSPEGQWAPDAVKVLNDIGDWMAINAEAIHGTKPMWPYQYLSYEYRFYDE